MENPDYGLILIGAIAGGFINGLAGFGTSLFALGFFLSVLPPIQSVALVLLLSILTGLQGLWIVRATVLANPRRLFRFLFPAFVGIPFGVIGLRYVDVPTLRIVIASFLLLYGGFFAFRRDLPLFERPTPAVDASVGFLGGFLGGLASLSGALPTMWCAMRPWPKSEMRAVLQPFNVAVLTVSATLLAIEGAYTAETMRYAAIAIPTALIASQIGVALYGRMQDQTFRRLLVLMCLLSGLILALRELM